MNTSTSGGWGSSLSLRGITWESDSRSGTRLGPIDLDAAAGRFIAILGPAGSGKTGLVKVLAGLSPPVSGEIRLDDVRVTRPARQVGYVPAAPSILPWRSVLDNVTAPLELCGIDPKTRESRGRMLLAAMELSSHERDRPGDLEEHLLPSISICRAMIHEPSILLLDEPFAELDPVQRERACTNLQLLWMKEPRTAVLATRSIQEAVHLSDLVVVLAPRLGARAPRIEIDLPRPRRFDKLMTPAMAEYGNQIRNILHAEGALP